MIATIRAWLSRHLRPSSPDHHETITPLIRENRTLIQMIRAEMRDLNKELDQRESGHVARDMMSGVYRGGRDEGRR